MKFMWKQVLLAVIGISGGLAVSGGLFALIIALGVVSRFAGKTHTAKCVFWYEDAVALGGILGCIASVYAFGVPLALSSAAGNLILGFFGIFAGTFVGAWAMALTEVVNIIPIFTRRITLRRGMELIILSMALGRTLGALLYYGQGWQG